MGPAEERSEKSRAFNLQLDGTPSRLLRLLPSNNSGGSSNNENNNNNKSNDDD